MTRLAKNCAVKAAEFGAVTGRPRRCGWLDLPLLRYSSMINGIEWLVVTKMDVLDDLAEIPVCIGYKINGKKATEISAQACGYDKIEPIYRTLPGWQKPTSGISSYDKLPAKAKAYLDFLAKETGAKIGMVSTGPDRDQTMFGEGFESALPALKKEHKARAKKSTARR